MKSDKFNRIYLVVPRIIEQPTWGGDYILKNKKWAHMAPFRKLKIGQSYELFSGSRLDTMSTASDDVGFTGELGYAMDPGRIHYAGDHKQLIDLSRLIKTDPAQVLGTNGAKKFGQDMKILIKFTQARGNSFQLHVKENARSKKWHFKPESWYYLEPGILTLGVKKNINWNNYENACRQIDRELTEISQKIRSGKIRLATGKKAALNIVHKYNPWKYVNTVTAKKDELIDLSGGGVHHSWEESTRFPLGNIVYELCYDVMDPVSSIRCFDKGKMKDDGSLRALAIDDYFRFVDRRPSANMPAGHRLVPKIIRQDRTARIETLLRSKYYSMDQMVLRSAYRGSATRTQTSFHHLFMRSGSALIAGGLSEIKLTQGHSCFIPARVGEYEIIPLGKTKVKILKTFIK